MTGARDGFAEAARAFATVVASLGPAAWQGPGLGEWTMRDLVGHTSRALTTVETYLARPAARIAIKDAAAYYAATRAGVDHAAVAERGRAAGADLGTDPAGTVADLAARVVARVHAAPDDATVLTLVGGMRLDDYLATRVLELTVHSLDILVADGQPLAFPDVPLRLTYRLAADLAADHPEGPAALLALAGRRSLPAGFSMV